jgi:hypothetical protein
MTPAPYRVCFSDGVCQERLLTPREVRSWVARSNEEWAKTKTPYRIVRVLDAARPCCVGRARSDQPLAVFFMSASLKLDALPPEGRLFGHVCPHPITLRTHLYVRL